MISLTAFVSLFLALILPSASCEGRSKEIYAVCSGSYTTAARAEERAEAMQKIGGGGYVYEKGLYYVLSAAYVSEADCDNVVAKLGKEHQKLAVPIAERFSDVSRCVDQFSEFFYAIDSGTSSAREILAEVKRFAKSEKFFERVSDPERKSSARGLFSTLAALNETGLSVNLKYYQSMFVNIFAK